MIEEWMDNLNFGANVYTKNIKNKAGFHKLFSGVETLYEQSESLPEEKLYQCIFEKSGIEKLLEQFVIQDKQVAGAVLVIGTKNHHTVFAKGNQQELDDHGNYLEVPMQEDSIFDLASVTKLFTCISVLKLIDEGLLKLTDCISDKDQRFLFLNEVTVEDLLSFRVPLKTQKRIQDCQSAQEVENVMFEITPDVTQQRLYSDMGAMVLKYVVEAITGKKYWEFVRENILIPCDMKDTVIQVCAENEYRIVSNNYEMKILNTGYQIDEQIKKGVVSDGKARKINEFDLQLHGHAGLFSTAADMVNLISALLDGCIINKRWVMEIGRNRVGKKNADGSYTQFHGYLCYSKNPDEKASEVSHWLSGNSFALGGYTGNQLTIDPQNGLYVLFLSNRCHNRITYISPAAAVNRTAGGKILWNNGKEYSDNSQYVYLRDKYAIRPAVETAMQCRYLEKLMERENTK